MKEENKCIIRKAKRSIYRIVIHCSATPEGKDFRKSDIDEWHNAKDWNGCGYHYVVDLDGKIELGRYIEDKGAHAGVYNQGSVGICYIGGMDKNNKKAKDTRTPEQKESLLWLIGMMRRLYPNAVVLGHRDLPGVSKACPSFDAYTEYKLINKE